MRRLLRLSRIRIRRGVLWLWRQEGTPGQRARGLAAGVFCGCYPFFGLQIFLSVGVASVVRGNHLLAAAGTLVSNPLTYLPLYWFNYLVGCRLLGPGQGGINLAELNRSSLWGPGMGVQPAHPAGLQRCGVGAGHRQRLDGLPPVSAA